MALTKEQRDALPPIDFAVPKKRELPIHDKAHVSMAWKMVDRTKDLTSEERANARKRILKRAKKLGIDTENWELHAMRFESIEAMAIEIPHVENHPNKTPFSGILARVDSPSNNPLGKGTNGKRVILPKDVAEKALPSLLGMAVDFTPSLDGHDAQRKIGLITEATIEGDALCIKGFFYSADFPAEVERIQAEKSRMGFSYEAQARIKSMDEDPLVIDSCFFTGAAVLYKDKAAYTTTTLSANSERKMEIEKAILEKIESLTVEISELKAQREQDAAEKKVHAASVHHMVKEHADKLRSCAGGIAASGMGLHPKHGHVAVLHDMADKMEADAMMGKLPHVYQTNDFFHASAKEDESENKELNALKDVVSSLATKLEDVKSEKFHASAEPERKTLPPHLSSLLAKSGINPESSGKFDMHKLDQALAASGITGSKSMALKMSLNHSGLLAA